MKNVFQTNKITNAELEKQFATQLATGKVVLIHSEDTINPEWKTVYLAQKRQVESRGSAPSAGMSSISKMLKGWDSDTTNNYIVRHIENINVAVIDSMGLNVGSTLPEGALIGIEDKHEPQTPNQKPIVSSDGEIRESAGKPVYTHTFLSTVEEYVGDKVMKFDYTPATKSVEKQSFAAQTK
jgi:hypothetical protein